MKNSHNGFLQVMSIVATLVIAGASAAEAQAVKERTEVDRPSEASRRGAETSRTDIGDREAREREEADRARENARREREARDRVRGDAPYGAAPATPGVKEDPKIKAARSIANHMLSHE